MNIRKIIKEEVNDFDWVGDIEPFTLDNSDWVIHTKTEAEWLEVEQFFFENGWYWYGKEDSKLGEYDSKYMYFYPDWLNRLDAAGEDIFYDDEGFLYGQYCDHKFYEWSDLKGLVD
jgi:hypothetical protein